MFYLADRVADTSRVSSSDHGTARHAFHLAHRPGITILAGGLVVLLGIVTPGWLSPSEFRAGIGLLGVAAGYFCMTHRHAGLPWTTLVPKEAAVGLIFAVGTVLFVGCQTPRLPGNVLLAAGIWSILCFLNCALITRWQQSARDLGDRASLLNAFPTVVAALPAGCLALATVTGALTVSTQTTVFLPLAASAYALWYLDRHRAALSADALRVLADVALLTPWVFLGLSRGTPGN